jgi:hypothetical protein
MFQNQNEEEIGSAEEQSISYRFDAPNGKKKLS